MLLIVISLLLVSSYAQIKNPIPQLPGWGFFNYTGSVGYFNSHPGYMQPYYPYYSPGMKTRYVVNVPQGQRAQVSIDPRNPKLVKLRSYDFIVMFDGDKASGITLPCQVSGYTSLGQHGPDYLPLVAAVNDSVRTFTSRSNVAVVDFCVHEYNSGWNDPTMVGFQVSWVGVGIQPTRPPVPPPTWPPVTAAPTLATVAPQPVDAGQCGVPVNAPSATPNVRIVNGVHAAFGSWPAACALVENGGQFCGCTIIAPQWVMTAGHCTEAPVHSESQMKRTVKVYMGGVDLTEAEKQPGSIRGISRVIRHQQYDKPPGSTSNDITLIKLDSPITFTRTLGKACLPTEDVFTFPRNLPVGTPGSGLIKRRICYVAGWGTLRSNQNSASGTIGSGDDLLRQTSIEIFSEADCRSHLPNTFDPKTMLCGGYDGGGYDSCQGDSGGPMMCDQGNGTWAIYGIVSWGEGCADPGKPGVYTNVNSMRPWITTTMIQN